VSNVSVKAHLIQNLLYGNTHTHAHTRTGSIDRFLTCSTEVMGNPNKKLTYVLVIPVFSVPV